MNGLQSGVFRMDDPMEYKRKILNLYLNRHTMDIMASVPDHHNKARITVK